jgi:hypothetical protein
MRRIIMMLLAVVVLAGAIAPAALAGPCDAYFRFDGDLSDSSGNGYDGQLVVSGGAPATTAPRFFEGKFGQSLALDGEAAMFSPIALQKENCPQMTITAWVLEHTDAAINYLVSTGEGGGPGLAVGTYQLSAFAGSHEIRLDHAVRRGIWIFVAGTWDYEAGVHRIHWRHRWEEAEFPEEASSPEPGLWVGGRAYYSALHYLADGVAIDDLRVWGRVLTEEELRQVQAAGDPSLAECHCGATSRDSDDALNDLRPDPLPLEIAEGGGSTTTTGGDSGQDDSGDEPPPPDDSPRGKPRPTGAPAYSSVAGNTGGNKRMLDLGDTFFESIWWSEKTDRPCFIRLNGPQSADLRYESLSLGCSLGAGFQGVDVYGYGIGGMEVCNNDNANGRLKGIRIYGTKIENDGSTTYAPISDEEALTNCRVWSPMVLCPGDKLATGLVVHSNDSSGSVEQIVGLQLICRDITVE